MDINFIFEYVKYDYLYNDCNKLTLDKKVELDSYIINNNKEKFIENYLKYISYYNLNEGLINSLKAFVRFIYNSINNLKKIVKMKSKNSKLAKTIDNNPKYKLTLDIGKFSTKLAAGFYIYYKYILKTVNPYRATMMAALLSIGAPKIVAAAISIAIINVAYNTSIKLLIKIISIINGAIKKWAFGDEDKETIKKESYQLAKVMLNNSKKSLNKIKDPEKKQKLMQRTKEIEMKLNTSMQTA